MIKMNLDKQYYPAKDEIFSIMFENRELFERLINAVLGEAGRKPIKVTQPKCQYTITGDNVKANNIRFDVFARDEADNLYSIDMQGAYKIKRICNRLTYYVCRAVSNEVVVDNRYEDLKNVCVTFIMSKQKNNEPIICYQLCNNKTGELYTDLLTIYEIYAPQADALPTSSELRVFLKFFTIKSDSDAEKFAEEFKDVPFASTLVQVYNSALTDKSKIDDVVKTEKFQEKNLEERLIEMALELNGANKRVEEANRKAEEAEKNLEEANRRTEEANKKAEKTSEHLAKSVKALRGLGQSNEQIAKTLDLSVEEVEQL